MGSHEASKVTLESIRQRMLEVEQVHRRGKKTAITDALIKDIGWLFRRIGFLTGQVRKLEAELEAMAKEKKELSDDNVLADKIKMLMSRLQDSEEKLRIVQQQISPLKRENNGLKQEMKLLLAKTQKAERRAAEYSAKLKEYEEGLDIVSNESTNPFPMS